MQLGRATAGVLLLLAAVSVALAGGTGADRLLVDETGHHRGMASTVHVAIDPGADVDQVEVRITVEGPAETTRLSARPAGVDDPGQRLVTLAWTPERVGEHRIVAEAVVGGEVREIGERSVEVHAHPDAATSGSPLPETAPGTVQWAIAFSILFFVGRAGLGWED